MTSSWHLFACLTSISLGIVSLSQGYGVVPWSLLHRSEVRSETCWIAGREETENPYRR